MYNGYIKESDLSEAAKEYLDKVEVRTAQKDIVKDYRYTVDKYFIHTPITINYKVTARNNVNDMAVKYIAQMMIYMLLELTGVSVILYIFLL